MSQSTTQRIDTCPSLENPQAWHAVCRQHDLVSNSGVVVWLDGAQVALFYLPDAAGRRLYAVDNRDPQSGANVIGRGLVGSLKGDLVIASPLYKQHFRLADGSCLEDPRQRLRVWPVRLNAGVVEVGDHAGYHGAFLLDD